MAERTIVDIGKYLQKHGLNIGEHPAFGGVGGGHSPTGYHPVGQAIDVRDWRPDLAPAYEGGKALPWKQRTGELSWRAKQLGLFNEALGPGDRGHDTHVHLALEGKKYITDPQLEWLATGRVRTPGGGLTDVMPGAAQPAQQAPQAPVAATQEVASPTFQQLLNQQISKSLVASLLQPQQPSFNAMEMFGNLLSGYQA
jgi:hypothetical protein